MEKVLLSPLALERPHDIVKRAPRLNMSWVLICARFGKQSLHFLIYKMGTILSSLACGKN